MIDTQAIRSKILDLAMRGQLTEQLPEDGTADELFQQIQVDKQILIEAGKIKKEKKMPVISLEEIPFDLPCNWRWVRLKELCTKIVDGDHNPPSGEKDSTAYLMLSAQNINNGKLCNLDKVRYLSSAVFEEENKRTQLEFEDVLLTIVGTIGRSCVYHGGYNICFQRSVAVISTMIDSKFLKYALDIPFIQNFMIANATGAAQLGFYLNKLEKLLIPLPPLSEQQRIVENIEQTFSVLDTIDELQAQYADNLSVLKSKLIDAAIQGKLTKQLPEDGNAKELYQKIQEEKQRLIKEGKIKESKPLPEITEDEIPFDIPDNWKWVYLGDIFQHNTGKALNSSDSQGKRLEYITTSNLYWDRFELDNLKTMLFTDAEIEKCTVKKGDLLVCEGGDIGRSAIWLFDNEIQIQNHIHRLRSYGNYICVRFFYYVMWLYKHTGRINGIGIGLQGLSSKRIHSLVVPLPPLAEQKRIVQKLDEILILCDKLK